MFGGIFFEFFQFLNRLSPCCLSFCDFFVVKTFYFWSNSKRTLFEILVKTLDKLVQAFTVFFIETLSRLYFSQGSYLIIIHFHFDHAGKKFSVIFEHSVYKLSKLLIVIR